MMWLLDICFSHNPPSVLAIALLLVFALPDQGQCTTVTGDIRLVGSQDAAVRKRHDLSGVVIWLAPAEPVAVPITARRARMVQKNKRFDPHILAIAVGTTVDFPNFDPIFHSAFSNFSGQIFDIGLYPPGTTRSIYFRRPGVVRVFCNIHPSMSAIIAVLDSPYFSVSDHQGKFVIPSVSPGTYHLHIIHERTTPETLSRLSRVVNISGVSVTLPLITVSEAGYLPAPHKNKYGLEYPATSDDVTGYPALSQ